MPSPSPVLSLPPAPRVARARAAPRRLLLLAALAAGCGDDLAPDGGEGATGGSNAEEGISIEGLDGPADVYFDAHGILHASCLSDDDCFAVEGYFHAAHRFVQMDIRRRVGRGKLAAVIGSVGLDIDRAQRRLMTARDGTPLEQKLLEAADPSTRAALDAYSRGVNAWLRDLASGANGAALADEYSFPLIDRDAVMDDWEPLDSVGCILPLLAELTEQDADEILAGQIYGALSPAMARDLFGLRPPSPSTILPAVGTAAGSAARAASSDPVDPVDAAAARLHERMAASRALFERALTAMPRPSLDNSAVGSNNWIVGPARTSGGALLANDPHLSLSHPAIWYLVHLDARSAGSGTVHVAGASFAGLPGVLLGQNEEIAWGATTTVFDSTDVYVEQLNGDGSAVIFDGREVPIEQIPATFEVARQDPVTESFPFVPHHGPITAADEKAGTALSVRWTGHEADTDINLLLRLATATSVDEARTALESSTTAGQNWVVVDRTGTIGWFPYMRLPERAWASAELPPWLPLPGDGSAEWGDPIPYPDLPQAEDPPAGFLATANNDMTGALHDGDPTNDGFPFLQSFVDPGYRHQRIVERLAQRGDHDLASMQAVQADVFSMLGQLTTRPILDSLPAPPTDPDARAVVDALAGWDFTCPTGLAGTEPDAPVDPDSAASARGCAAFHVTWSRLRRMVFGDELAAAGVEAAAQPAALIFALTEPSALGQDYWDDVSTAPVETRADIVGAALASAGEFLRQRLGEPDAWLWGRLHTLSLRADLFSAVTDQYDSARFANDGGRFTVDVGNPDDELADDYDQSSGPSMRLACQADASGVRCTIELPGGQRHFRDSPFYDNMLDDWLANRPVPLLFSIDEVAAEAVESVRIEPR